MSAVFCEGTEKEKLLELTNEWNKVAVYKIYTQKSVMFLYTTMKNIKKTFKNNSICHSISKMKYLGIDQGYERLVQ